MRLGFSRGIFEKLSNIEFRGNRFDGRRVVPCERADRQKDGQTDRTKLIVAFRKFRNCPGKS